MDVELTRDEEELILFISNNNNVGNLKQIQKDFTIVSKPDNIKNILDNLVDKNILHEFVFRFESGKLITLKYPFYKLTEQGRELVEWM